MSYHLPRIVGTSVAADWMLTGRTVSAEEAYRRGLVSELVDGDRPLVVGGRIATNVELEPVLEYGPDPWTSPSGTGLGR